MAESMWRGKAPPLDPTYAHLVFKALRAGELASQLALPSPVLITGDGTSAIEKASPACQLMLQASPATTAHPGSHHQDKPNQATPGSTGSPGSFAREEPEDVAEDEQFQAAFEAIDQVSQKTGLFGCPMRDSEMRPGGTIQHWGCCSIVRRSIKDLQIQGINWSPFETPADSKICPSCQQEGTPMRHPEKKSEISIKLSAQGAAPEKKAEGKRKPVRITPESDLQVKRFAAEAQASSKVPSTLSAYSSAERVWVQLRDLKVPPLKATSRALGKWLPPRERERGGKRPGKATP